MNNMNFDYESPLVEIIEVEVERGFEVSTGLEGFTEDDEDPW